MDGWIIYTLTFLLFTHFLSSGHARELKLNREEQLQLQNSNQRISTAKKDITTPITTVPTIIPATPTTIMNPTSTPDSATPAANTVTSTVQGGGSWCIASQSASKTGLQVALDYACGYGGADCRPIQVGEKCYYPNTIRDHASFAFNAYYQKNPLPNSCNFGGTAVVTSTDPSSGTCLYPSTSTSSSVLNTTNSSGSTVFGAVPSTPSTSAAVRRGFNINFLLHFLIMISLSFFACDQ